MRNIFICSGLVFWASSRMMKLSLSVRPRMNASGATSITPALQVLADPLGLEHVVQRVEQRAQVGIDLGHQVARAGSPSRSPASTAGRVRMIRLTSRRLSAAAASATARNVLPVPAGPIPNVIVLWRIEST